MGNHLQEVKFSATFQMQSLTSLLRPGRLSPHSETSLGTTAEESTATKNMNGPDSGAGIVGVGANYEEGLAWVILCIPS